MHREPQGTLLKFGDLSNAREYSICTYSDGLVLRSVTSAKVKGYPGSLARVFASYTDWGKQFEDLPGLIHICLRCNFTNEIIDVKVTDVTSLKHIIY